MSRQTAFAVGAAVVVGVALLAALAVPGALADPTADERPDRPGRVTVVEAPVSVGQVTGQQAELVLHTVLRHRGPPTENVSVRFRAVDAESGLLAATRTVEVGRLEGDGETTVSATLPVERAGGYRLEAIVYRNDTRVAEFSRRVSGVRALTPAYARSNVSFVDDPVLSPLSVSVEEAEDNRTTLDVGAWLTATGPSEGDRFSVTLLVRQADSNLVADRVTVTASDLRAGRTELVSATVTVPSGYNYYVDAVLTRDGVVLDTATGVVNLDPQETISRNETQRDVEFEVADFEKTEAAEETPTPRGSAAGDRPTDVSTPGFGPVAAVVALAVVALAAWRRR